MPVCRYCFSKTLVQCPLYTCLFVMFCSLVLCSCSELFLVISESSSNNSTVYRHFLLFELDVVSRAFYKQSMLQREVCNINFVLILPGLSVVKCL